MGKECLVNKVVIHCYLIDFSYDNKNYLKIHNKSKKKKRKDNQSIKQIKKKKNIFILINQHFKD